MAINVYKDFSAGLNLQDHPSTVGPHESPNALNVVGTEKGDVQPRKGLGVLSSFQAFLGSPHQVVILAEFNPRNRILPPFSVSSSSLTYTVNPSSAFIAQGETRWNRFGQQSDANLTSPYFDLKPDGGSTWAQARTTTDQSPGITNVRVIKHQLITYYCAGGVPIAPIPVDTDTNGAYGGIGSANFLEGRGPKAGNGSACVAGGTGTADTAVSGTLEVAAAFAPVTGAAYMFEFSKDGNIYYTGFGSDTGGIAQIQGADVRGLPILGAGALGCFANPHNYVIRRAVKIVYANSQS